MIPNDIREYLSYDPDSGALIWTKKPKGRGYPFKVGDVAGCVRPDGRRVICFRGKLYMAYRLAWFLHYGEDLPESVGIDHANMDASDDRIANLRICDQSLNMLNINGHKDKNSSRHKGVSWHAQRRKWVASFRGEYLGLYEEELEAAAAYDKAARLFNREFSRVNIDDGGPTCLV